MMDNPWSPAGSLGSDWSNDPDALQDNAVILTAPGSNQSQTEKTIWKPTAVEQQGDWTCWAAALSSFLQTIHGSQAQYAFERIIANAAQHTVTAPDGKGGTRTTSIVDPPYDFNKSKSEQAYLAGSLLQETIYFDEWETVLSDYGLVMERHSEIDENDLYKWGPTDLSFEKLKNNIDQYTYVLLAYVDPSWVDRKNKTIDSHVVVVYGYAQSPEGIRLLEVFDPNPNVGFSEMTYRDTFLYVTAKSVMDPNQYKRSPS